MAEFALVLPVLLILVFGIIDFGLAIYDKAVITNASREGARAGIVFRSSPPPSIDVVRGIVTDVVNTYCATHLASFGGTGLQAPEVTGSTASGGTLTVTVRYQYSYLAVANFLGLPPLNMSSTTVMRVE